MDKLFTDKKQRIVMFGVGVILILTLIIGFSYAYFFVGTNGGPIRVDVEAAVVANVIYEQGQDVTVPINGIYPGWAGVHTFRVVRPDGMMSGTGEYSVVIENESSAGFADWIHYELYKTTDSSKNITRTEGTLGSDDGIITQRDSLTFTNFSTERDELVSSGIINSAIEVIDVDSFDLTNFDPVNYYLVVYFAVTEENQNSSLNSQLDLTISLAPGDVTSGSGANGNELLATSVVSSLTDSSLDVEEDLDGNVRFIGSDPDNYVRFNGETWRIVGSYTGVSSVVGDAGFTRLKLVGPSTGVSAFGSSTWSTSTVLSSLNTYFGTLTSRSQGMVASSVWNFGSSTGDLTVDDYYESDSIVGSLYTGNIAIMSPSDYGYATSGAGVLNYERVDCVSTISASDWNATNRCAEFNYLNDGTSQWLMMGNGSNINYVNASGVISSGSSTLQNHVRPTVYLKSHTVIESGSGTIDDPYRLITR